MSPSPTRVLVVDDSAVVRQTLLALLTEHGSFDVAVAAGSRAVTIQQRPKPDVGCPALDFRWTFQ